MNDKSLLRKKMRSLLNTVTPHSLSTASKTICQHFCSDLRSTSPAPVIAIFAAHGQEIDLQSLHASLPGARLLYPLCHPGGMLSFHHTPTYAELTPGKLGILEPNSSRHQKVKIKDIHLFLCPGLAFGRDATRLGHGGGYYDRALTKRASTAITIGIGLQIQILDTVPHDQHDIHLDHVLTEKGYII